MDAEIKYFLTTRVDGCNFFNTAADFFLTPVRTLHNGRTYHLFKDDDGDWLNLMRTKETKSKVNEVVKKIFAVLVIATVIPVVLGLVLKYCAIRVYPETKENYRMIKNHDGEPLILYNNLKLAPKNKGFNMEKERKDALGIDLNLLLVLWDQLGHTRRDLNGLRNSLEELIDKSGQPNYFRYIRAKYARQASEQLRIQLKLIIKELLDGKLSFDKKEGILVEIAECAKQCSPTWLEVVNKKYQELRASAKVRNSLLKYIQKFKEEKILEMTQNGYQPEWHGLNYVRYHLGKELGLDRSNLQYDGVIARGILDKLMKPSLLIKCLQNYTHVDLIPAVQTEINDDPYKSFETLKVAQASLFIS